jgi:hypothetical protein
MPLQTHFQHCGAKAARKRLIVAELEKERMLVEGDFTLFAIRASLVTYR